VTFFQRLVVLTVPAVLAVATTARAQTYQENFDDGVADGFTLNGTVNELPSPPVVDSGMLRLTNNVNSSVGSAILRDLNPGTAIQSYTFTFTMQSGPGTNPPADGISVVFGQLAGTEVFGEEGPGGFNGLVISADYYVNGPPDGSETRREYTVSVNGAQVAAAGIDPYTNGQALPAGIVLEPGGVLTLLVAGNPIFFKVPTGFVPEMGDRFGFGARTGGLNAQNRIDDVVINTVVVPEPAALGLVAVGALLLTRPRRARPTD